MCIYAPLNYINVKMVVFRDDYLAHRFILPMSKPPYNRIKAALAEKNVTNIELADALGKNVHTISRWCTNENQPPVETFYEIAEYLDVSIYELLVDNKKK